MDPKSAASAYKASSIENSPPLKIVHKLYEGAIRFIDQAATLDPEKDVGSFNERVNRADAIVCELRLSLDLEASPELVAQLAALYMFAEEQLREALLKRTLEPLAAARDVLTTLYEGWKELDVRMEQQSS